jgi:hypothetical protein
MPCYMSTAHVLHPLVLDFVAAAMDDVAEVMRQRVPQFIFHALSCSTLLDDTSQRSEVLVRVASVTVDGVMVSPAAHVILADSAARSIEVNSHIATTSHKSALPMRRSRNGSTGAIFVHSASNRMW